MLSKSIYTLDQWRADQSFKAKPYQQIQKEIYDCFLCSLPPLRPGNRLLEQCFEIDTGEPIKIVDSFQNSEPVSHIQNSEGKFVPTFHTFAVIQTSDSDTATYYFGVFPEIK